jgi:hypothetical protein
MTSSQIPKTVIFFDTIKNAITYLSPNVQRLLNEEHVSRLVTDQMWEYQTHRQFSMMQSITCADLNGKRYVLDGQHRLAAFKELNMKGYDLSVRIPVVCYNVESFEELKSYYLRINKHHPINPLETSTEWFNDGKSFCTWFVAEYKPYLKTTNGKSNCPHINMNEMMTYIKDYRVFERVRVDSDMNQLINTVKGLNKYMIDNTTTIVNCQIGNDFSNKFMRCINKNVSQPCILGVWRRFEWIEIALYVLQTGVSFSEINLSQFTAKRPKISKKRRLEVWQKRNGNTLQSKCFVCEYSLEYDDMECGHVVPFVYGGDSQVDNLEPICKSCNREMGIMNLNDYKKII